jgi:ribosomal protein S18 acetylase RimI-like enzyme
MLDTRPGTSADLPLLEDIFLRAMAGHITDARGFWDEATERKQFSEQLQLEHTRIIEGDGEPIGFLMVLEHEHDLELHTICIAPEHQSRGIGTAVIRQLLSDAQKQEREVFLSVLKPNTAARALYERLGFVVTGETRHHFQMRLVS